MPPLPRSTRACWRRCLPYFSETFGNPSSVHRIGQRAEAALETARETIAGCLNCRPDEIIFTSCGSESDNLALRGAAFAMREKNGANWILCSRAEHPAVSPKPQSNSKNCTDSRLNGWMWMRPAMVTPAALEKAICDKTALVSVMFANNEFGTVNPIPESGANLPCT
jgi:cysteine desulfurase